jgi:hypothetical protein
MKHLSRFTPAETILLLEGDGAKLRDLLRVTLMDLLIKQVLHTTEVERLFDEKTKSASDTYFVRGPGFLQYRSFAHEAIFISPFLENEKAKIFFKNLVRVAYDNARDESHYGKLILKNDTVQPYFARGISKIFNGKFSLTQEGETIQQEIISEIKVLEKELPHLMESDQARALAILTMIKGNAFLIKGVDLKMMREIESHLVSESNSRTVTSSFPDTLTWLALTHTSSFDHYGDDWGAGGDFDID